MFGASGAEPSTPMEQAPCGCRFAVVGDAFVLEACPLGLRCEVVRYAQAEAGRQAKPAQVVEL